jgi:hypothetical protein
VAARLISLLFLLLACGERGDSRPDHEIYLAALAPGADSPEQRLKLCDLLAEPLAKGDCGTQVVVNAARNRHPNPESFCESVEKGPWRAECFFEMAEFWRRKKDHRRAAELCAKSGPFIVDCGQHLWQGEVRGLVEGRTDWAGFLLKADNLFEKWGAIFSTVEDAPFDFVHRFWRRLFQNVFESEVVLSTSACASMDAFHQDHCRAALGHLYLRRLQQIVRHAPELESFCAVSAESLADIQVGELTAPSYRVERDPIFEQVLRRLFEHSCVQGKALPVPSEWLRSKSQD